MARPHARVKGVRQAVGMAMLAFDMWRRLPAKRRRQLYSLARRHGPKLVKRAVQARRGSR